MAAVLEAPAPTMASQAPKGAQAQTGAQALIGLPACVEGRRVRGEQVDAEDSDGCRLRELGVYEGAEARVVTQGDPVVLSVFGNRLAICRRCAGHVLVRQLG